MFFEIAAAPKEEIKSKLPAYVALARCAEERDYFILQKSIAQRLFDTDPVAGHPELLARAFVGLGAFGDARRLLETAAKKNPKDGNVAVTFAKVTCLLGDWEACQKHAAEAYKLSLAEKDPAEKKAIGARAKKYAARAALHLGKLDEANRAADESEKLGGDKRDLEEVRDALVPAKNFGIVLHTGYDRSIELGTYHLLGKMAGVPALVRVSLTNLEKEDRQFRVETEISGVTERGSTTLTIRKSKGESALVTPPLKTSFTISNVRAPQSAQLVIKITAIGKGGEKVVYDQTHPIELMPRDHLPLFRFIDAEKLAITRTSGFIAAWITPNAKPVDTFLSEAKKRAPRETFSGLQSATIPQVKALFDELKARGVSYVMDPDVGSDDVKSQRTRLPTEVLASGNAQCLEGAILYATLLEAIGLEPAVVLVPGHAFVSWRPSPKDGVATPLFLETTMTHSAEFEEAMATARGEFETHSKNGVATVIDIKKLRTFGVTPQPYD